MEKTEQKTKETEEETKKNEDKAKAKELEDKAKADAEKQAKKQEVFTALDLLYKSTRKCEGVGINADFHDAAKEAAVTVNKFIIQSQ